MGHVTMTLRSCDFFGRVMINPQEVMMLLSPVERLTHTHSHSHTHTHTVNIFEDDGIAMSNVEFKDLLCIFQI